jgi:hypothetical protein
VVKIQITVFGDESFTTSKIEDVFGFTAKNIYVEVWLGRDNPSAALYKIGISMWITPDVSFAGSLIAACHPTVDMCLRNE